MMLLLLVVLLLLQVMLRMLQLLDDGWREINSFVEVQVGTAF